jgi:hypothetical protein
MIPDVLKNMSWPVIGAVVGVIVLLVAGVYLYVRSGKKQVQGQAQGQEEGFGTSPGTLTQLAANHVPTEEDEEAAQQEARREQHEADEMTTEHPPV